MNGLVVLATFLAAAVEWVEALTIVLAVGIYKSWRTALLATGAGLGVLAILVILFGVTLRTYLPESVTQSAVGLFLLLFGLGWLYKAILRSSGLKALHDEAEAFEETREQLMTRGHAFGTAFTGVFLEGLEVVFIVVALGGLNSVPAAVTGAAVSLIVVVVAGGTLRHPLTRVPENLLKYAVGVMLTSFGTFFVGEGVGVAWWNEDASILVLIAIYAGASLVFVAALQNRGLRTFGNAGPMRWLGAAASEAWGLFVTNGLLSACAVVAVLLASIWVDRAAGGRYMAAGMLVAGILVAVTMALVQASRARKSTELALEATVGNGAELSIARSTVPSIK